MSKKVQRCISIILAIILAALGTAGCSSKQKNKVEQQDPSSETTVVSKAKEVDIYGYDEPIDLTCMMDTSSISVSDASYTLEDNPFIELYKEHGMNVTYKLVGKLEDISMKLDMAISTGDLPDIMWVTPSQFQELSEAGMLADLTAAYETYTSDRLKEWLYYDDGLMMNNVTVDGKLLGVVRSAEFSNKFGCVSIRKDWLEECGLEEPKTMDDLWNIGKTFKEKKMGGTCNIAIAVNNEITTVSRPMVNLLNAYHAYVNIWIEKDGELVNSTIQPEMKEALAALSKKYQERLIDPEFGTKTRDNNIEDALVGKVGVLIDDIYTPFGIVNGVKNNGQEWGYYSIPSADEELVKNQQSTSFKGCIAISAKCEHPEAIFKLLNLWALNGVDNFDKYNSNGVNGYAWPMNFTKPLGNVTVHNRYMEALENNPDDPLAYLEEIGVDGQIMGSVESAELWRKDGDPEGYVMWSVFGQDSTETVVTKALENNAAMVNVYSGSPTETMNKYNVALNALIEQMITNIVKGDKSIDYFDEFVSAWKKNGGDAITTEVNEWYRQKNAN